VFPLVMVAPDLNTGIHTLVQGFGIGHLRANIILLNWLERAPQDTGDQRELIYGHHLRTAFRLGCNLVVLDGEDPEWATLHRTAPAMRHIDVWWRGDASSRLMLLLAHLMTRSEDWEGARIRLLGMCCSAESAETAEALRTTLQEVRIEAEAMVVEQKGAEVLVQHSADSSLVFLPFRLHGDQPLGPFDGPLKGLLAPLPVTVLVLAAEDMDLDADPEEGTAAETARVLDALSDAERFAELTAKDAREAEATAGEVGAELKAEIARAGDPEAIAKLRRRLEELEAQREKARRRAARTAAKAQAARQEAQTLGLLPPLEGDIGDRRL